MIRSAMRKILHRNWQTVCKVVFIKDIAYLGNFHPLSRYGGDFRFFGPVPQHAK